MPISITDQPPDDVVDQLEKFSAALDSVIPPKELGRNLLIGTWNVRAFERVQPKWRSEPGVSPIRDLSNVLCIAEVISRFDVVAVQEVRRTAQAFLSMMKVLGDRWGFLVTDVTKGTQGNSERLAFVFDRQRIHPSGLACELVVAAEEEGVAENALKGQFARTPYAVSFAVGKETFTLVTLHVLWGEDSQARLPELTRIARWLADWAKEGDEWGTNLIALGDFNIDRKDDPLYQAFTSTGLEPPDGLNYVPRTIFENPDPTAEPNKAHFYDQIAWFTGKQRTPVLSFQYKNAGMFNFGDGLIPATTANQLSYRMSDHFPLWVEFRVPG
jgi:endonuclease/exonuclease/phosphatase family metal-dependent hydrolase